MPHAEPHAPSPNGSIRLVVTCPDQPGLIAAVTLFTAQQNGNIIGADQFTDADTGTFFLRLAIQLSHDTDAEGFGAAFRPLASRHNMTFRVETADRPKRTAILVSKTSHCLSDLVQRIHEGELGIEPTLVLSNHPDLERLAAFAGAPFHHLPLDPNAPAGHPAHRLEQERAMEELLLEHDIEFVVLARYMQVLSPGFVDRWFGRVINIHHSFLPAFSGARPYHRAHERGVKVIGATSHYVTSVLDEGPIITQATTRVDHRDSVADLIRKGRDLERMVLAEAVRLHAEDRVLISGNRTVVFS
ncbi:MAG: formyltetrahydrofolate deformylase [Phycisphaerales bacterium JB065]